MRGNRIAIGAGVALALVGHSLLAGGSAFAAAGAGTAYPTPATGVNPHTISSSSGGSMWFADGKLNKITGDGTVTTFTTPSTPVSGVASTSAGTTWYISSMADKVGTIDVNGSATEYATGYTDSVVAITIGRDGQPWFMDQLGKLGTVNAAGTLSLIGNDTTGTPFIGHIGTGPTDAAPLWATDSGTNNDAIIKYQTDGTQTRYALTNGDAPSTIATGADGNLWFTAFGGNYIGKMTTAGALTRYPVPTASSSPDGIALGPDSAMWFSERNANKIARITTDGTITEYSIPSGMNGPSGAAPDQYGNVWFGAQSSQFVAKVATSVNPTTAGPTLAGTGEYGQQLICGGDTWSMTPASTATSWYLDGALISGSTGTGYTPSADQVGKAVTCKVTATMNYMPTTLVATSNAITVVKPGDSPVSTLVVTLQPGPIKAKSGKSVSVKFNASMAAAVTLNVMAKAKVKITKPVSAVLGTNKVSIKLKVKKKALKPGTYSIAAVSGAGKTLDTVKLKVSKAKKK